MTKKFRITTEAYIDITWNPNEDLDALIKEFSESIYHIDTLSELEEFVVSQIQIQGSPSFIEGVGKVSSWKPSDESIVLWYNNNIDDVSVEAL